MFAIPGIVALLVQAYLRPQEYFLQLQTVPLLYLFLGLALFGLAVDVKLRHTQLVASPLLGWVLAFIGWSLFTLALRLPSGLQTAMTDFMKLMARDNEVLWLNSIATRTPKLSSSSDMGKIKRKLKSFVDGPQRVDGARGLSVFTPLVLPFPHSRAAVAMNRQILRGTTAYFRRRLGM